MQYFVHNDKKSNNFDHILSYNKFLLYKRYYVQRYVSLIKDVESIFYEGYIFKDKYKKIVFNFYDFFIPSIKKKNLNLIKELVKDYSKLDYY